jgi:hypothetical protein
MDHVWKVWLQLCEVMPFSNLPVLNFYILSMHFSNAIHTVYHQSAQRLHVTTALILPGVLIHYETIFRETHYSNKLLVTYINTRSIGF